MKTYRMLVTLVLFLGLGLAFAPVKTALAAGGAIGGVVTDEQGNPLENIVVTVLGDGNGFVVYQATDATGAYLVADLAPGIYRIGFADYYAPTPRYAGEYYDNVARFADATPITLAEGTTVVVNAQLTSTGNITGHVTDAAGKPVTGVRAAAYQYILNGAIK